MPTLRVVCVFVLLSGTVNASGLRPNPRITLKIRVYAVFKVHPCLFINPGGHLLSRTVSSAVPSAGRVLTVVFGMGTGVSPGRIAA